MRVMSDLLPQESLPGRNPDSPAIQRDGDRRRPHPLLDRRPRSARAIANFAGVLWPIGAQYGNQLRGVGAPRRHQVSTAMF